MTDLKDVLAHLEHLQFIYDLPFDINKHEEGTDIIIGDSIVMSFDEYGNHLETEEIQQ